jgi:hypothetical protein
MACKAERSLIRAMSSMGPIAAVALTACGTAPGSKSDFGLTSTVSEAFGESQCGSTPADYSYTGGSFDSSNGGWIHSATSPNGTYSHALCRNSYIASFPNADNLEDGFSAYAGPIVPPSWGCNGMWVNLSVWQKNGSTYQRVYDAPTAYGAQFGSSCVPPDVRWYFGSLTAGGNFKLIAQAGFATTYQPVTVGERFLSGAFDISSSDFEMNAGLLGENPHWAPASMHKGDCEDWTQALTGVSRTIGGTQHAVKSILCSDPWPSYQSPIADKNLTILDFSAGDDRRDTHLGDWDYGFVKGECDFTSVMIGLAQTQSGVIDRAVCARVQWAAGTTACQQLVFDGGDARASLMNADWVPGYYKGQCPDGSAIKGISKDGNGYVRSILCCQYQGVR